MASLISRVPETCWQFLRKMRGDMRHVGGLEKGHETCWQVCYIDPPTYLRSPLKFTKQTRQRVSGPFSNPPTCLTSPLIFLKNCQHVSGTLPIKPRQRVSRPRQHVSRSASESFKVPPNAKFLLALWGVKNLPQPALPAAKKFAPALQAALQFTFFIPRN